MIDTEVLIVGAGISGIGAAIELSRRGIRSFVVLEAAAELGGTWRDNTYPGIAVDIPSVSYCYPFEQDYAWSRLFAPGAEVLSYVRYCAHKYGVTDRMRFDSQALRSTFDVGRDVWETRLADGAVITSRFLIAATGLLSQPKFPAIPGLDTFAGVTFHTARWDHRHDLSARRVAVIGTGASAVQLVPEIAARVAELRVFQRTPIWVSPKFDMSLPPSMPVLGKVVARFLSEAGLEFLYFALVNFRRFPFVVRSVQRAVGAWMRNQVSDADTARRLVPDYGLGCKRPTISNGYLQAFNRENVHLVTRPIARVCAEGIVTQDEVVHSVDTIILATGFLTTERGNGPSFEVVGSSGAELGAFWEAQGRQCYAGVSLPDFPNFFLTAGPYSGGFNWFTMLAAHVNHIGASIGEARARGATRVDVTRAAHDRYMRRMRRRAEGTVFMDPSCHTSRSYYVDARGDASLPLPHTPWWRVGREWWVGTRDYRFTGSERQASLRDSLSASAR